MTFHLLDPKPPNLKNEYMDPVKGSIDRICEYQMQRTELTLHDNFYHRQPLQVLLLLYSTSTYTQPSSSQESCARQHF